MTRPRKKTAEENIDPVPTSEGAIAPADSPELLDKLAEGRQPPSDATPSPKPPASGFASKLTTPDPFGATSVALTDNNDGPKVRLYRSQKFQQMAIQFDEKPDESIRQKLREDGWTWRGAEGVWTKQLGERPGQMHRQAEEFFQTIANELRQARGLEPVTFETHSR
jgi:hypothetical protein